MVKATAVDSDNKPRYLSYSGAKNLRLLREQGRLNVLSKQSPSPDRASTTKTMPTSKSHHKLQSQELKELMKAEKLIFSSDINKTDVAFYPSHDQSFG